VLVSKTYLKGTLKGRQHVHLLNNKRSQKVKKTGNSKYNEEGRKRFSKHIRKNRKNYKLEDRNPREKKYGA